MDFNTVINTDLATLSTPVGVEFDENGTATAGFYVVGTDSPQYRAEEDRQRRANAKLRAARNGKKFNNKDDTDADMLAKLVDNNLLEHAIVCTIGWFGIVANGEPLPFDIDKVRQMYTLRRSWAVSAYNAVNEGANFLPKPAEVSGSTQNSSDGSTPLNPPQEEKA